MKNKYPVSIVCALTCCIGVLITLRAAETDSGAPAAGAPAAGAPADDASWTHLALTREANLPISDGEFARQINELGADGWEMVTVLNFSKEGTTTKTVYYFKKPL